VNQGIYEILNTDSGVRYIGSSVNIKQRFAEHLKMLKADKHHSIYLQRAWNKYGEQAFKFKIVAILEKSELRATEQRFLNVEHKGDTYNISKHPDAPMRGLKHKPETIQKMHLSRLGNKSRTGVPSHWSKEKPPPSLAALIAASKNPSKETRKKMSEARLGVSPANKGIHQTHCKRGHEMTEENTYSYIRNDRFKYVCRACCKLRIANAKEKNP
jgi:group I intron endonuclease